MRWLKYIGLELGSSTLQSCVIEYVRLAQMGIEDPNSHSGYRTRALGRQAQSQQRDRGEVEDRE